ncbi:MAG: DUF3656 domain-containing protein [Synechococcales bacterium]|nr:DUF3656 domain-containing protein [Synechococcales bacterium]
MTSSQPTAIAPSALQPSAVHQTPAAVRLPDLLAPAGNWDCARAAVENGADAIYFGLDRFNARMRSQNFTEADLPALMEFLHRRGVKGYVTLNTLIFPKELPEAEQYLRSMMLAGVDAVIVQDIGICRLIRHLSPDFPIHGSTQMTVTSAAGVEFAQQLDCQLVVLARECSLQEIKKIQTQIGKKQLSLPLEVFVHGALCVAYSGQCLTSEALGGRSANRGECAQACRMPYELIVDDQVLSLGDRKYLLSPQDLSGLAVLPELVQTGVTCLKIEGRLKTPEYVANVTRVYREAIDQLRPSETMNAGLGGEVRSTAQSDPAQYQLEMAFSRGLYTGWFGGINNQELVHARFGKKRGVYLGKIRAIQGDRVTLILEAPLKPGDGVVFDSGHPEGKEEGGRVYKVEQRGQETMVTFGKGAIAWKRVHGGDRLWKTSDPELEKQLRQSYEREHQYQRPIQITVQGLLGEPLTVIVRDELGHVVQVDSAIALVQAEKQPLTSDRLREQLGRLGNTPFQLTHLTAQLEGDLLLPVSELNRMRREFVTQLEQVRSQPKRWTVNSQASFQDLLPTLGDRAADLSVSNLGVSNLGVPNLSEPNLIVLVRQIDQLKAAIAQGITTLYCEFEDPRRYREAVQWVRDRAGEQPNQSPVEIFVAPPRITKPGENWILQQVRQSNADGYLVRNYDHLQFFADQRCIGDFSLNVANGLTADYFKQRFALERLAASYDLNIQQLTDLLTSTPPDWYEVTLHQHMPMFHMEHCVFCAFLSEGTDFTNCGRPCEKHQVNLRDRVGSEHILQADAGCRNTVFNATAQTGAEYGQHLRQLGVKHFRIEFVNESPEQVQQTIACYQQLLQGQITGTQLWKQLKLNHQQLSNQLGVTRGTLEKRGKD